MNSMDTLKGQWIQREAKALPGGEGLTEKVLQAILGGVERLKGPVAAEHLRRQGVQTLHEVLSAQEVGPLRDEVMEELRPHLLALSVAVGRTFLGWEEDFYVDDYLILRINLPYETARQAPPSAENPGIGRLTPRVRALFQSRKTIDPVFNPFGYHRDHPPAVWANAAHRDSWTGHSRDGRNIWWAIGDVPAEAGIVFYPELNGEILPVDPRTFYLEQGYPLPRAAYLPLKPGEMLVFDGDMLHGTHLNVTNQTRVAISMRINAECPTFDPACFFAREFWRRARDIEQGRDEVLHLRRDEHLGPPRATAPVRPRPPLPLIEGSFDARSGILRATLPEASRAPRVIVAAAPHRLMVVHTREGVKAYDAACPHYGLDLADGAGDPDRVYCPACAVGFDLLTGRSSCPALALKAHAASLCGNALEIRITP